VSRWWRPGWASGLGGRTRRAGFGQTRRSTHRTVIAAAAAVDPPPAAGGDRADLLHVQVDQLTWAFGLDPADLAVAVAGDVKVPEPADPEPAQPSVHGCRGHLDAVGGELVDDEAGWELPVPAQRLDPRHHRRAEPGRAAVRAAGPVGQRLLTTGQEPGHPLAHGRPGQPGLRGDMSLRAPLLQDPGDQTTTAFSGQRGVNVHGTGLLRRVRSCGSSTPNRGDPSPFTPPRPRTRWSQPHDMQQLGR